MGRNITILVLHNIFYNSLLYGYISSDNDYRYNEDKRLFLGVVQMDEKEKITQMGTDIKLLKDLSYDQGVEIKALKEQFKELLNELKMSNYKLDVMSIGKKIIKKQEADTKTRTQATLKGLSTK